ncbi:MAG: tetratricopeptide repeat protein [Myxococcota bacterium]
MEEQDHATGRPSVGNVLGFSLLLRDRQALLRLERRALSPGLRLSEYEAEIPDVEFPLRAHGAAAFRRRRCRARQLSLEVDTHTLAAWLRTRLVGRTVEGLHIEEVELRLAAPTEEGQAPAPCLYVKGHHRGRPQWLMITVQLLPRGRKVGFRPWQTWRLGDGPLDSDAIWRGIAARLTPTVEPDAESDGPGLGIVDPVPGVLLRPFVSAGWRTPDLGQLKVTELSLGPDRAVLSLSAGTDAIAASPVPLEPPRDPGPVVAHLERIHAALQARRTDHAATELERLTDELPSEHPARQAALQWLVSLSRGLDPTQRLRALRAWLHEAPRDETAARALVIELGRSGNDRALARRLAAECRLPHPPTKQARLELALATVLIDRLDEPQAGRGLLEPLLERCSTSPSLASLELPVRSALARALASHPQKALHQLTLALAVTNRSAVRASVQAEVATALDRQGHHQAATTLWTEVVSATPDDDELVDAALASARSTDNASAGVDLLRAAIPHASPERSIDLRRTLVTTLLERNDQTHQELAIAELRTLVRDNPDAADLAEQLQVLERHRGRPDAAASMLGTLAKSNEDAADRARLRLEQARILAKSGQPRRAWTKLEPALNETSAELEAELLEMAIEIAPLSIRDALLDRLVEIDDGPPSGRALLTRAQGRASDSKRRADLELAAERLDDPRPALRQLVELAGDEAREPWEALAEACATHEDARGERRARIELALRHLAHDDLDHARRSMARAYALGRRSAELALALGWLEAKAGNYEAAATLVSTALDGDVNHSNKLLLDTRLGLPPTPELVRAHLGPIFLHAHRPADAAALLRPAVEAMGGARQPQLAEALFEALEATGEALEAASIARSLADAYEGPLRAEWLARAARHAEPIDAASWLAEAVELRPEDGDLLAELERTARAAGDRDRLKLAQERAIEHPEVSTEARSRALRSLIARRRHGEASPTEDAELRALYERLLEIDDGDVEALLVLAQHDHRHGNEKRALDRWGRVLEELSAEDPRRIEPSLALATHELAHGQPERARERLLPLIEMRQTPREAHELLAEAALALGDAPNRLLGLRGIIAQAKEGGPVRFDAELQLARQLGALGRSHEALPHVATATRGFARGTPEHVDSARTWLSLALTVDDPRHEAAARIELRHALGRELSAKELRAEALLMAERLADPDGARILVEEGLAVRPSDALLLSTLKHLARTTGTMLPYLAAVEAAIEGMVPGDERDRLATELALTAAEDGDAARVHRALERISSDAGSSEELLDLRDWAVRNLGLEEEELRGIDDRLRAGAVDPALLLRLGRLVGQDEACVEHLLALVRESEGEVAQRIVTPALQLAGRVGLPSLTMQALRQALWVGAHTAAEQAWPGLVEQVSTAGDDAALADLVALADDAHEAGLSLDDRLDRLLDAALAHQPGSQHLHRALARHVAYRGSPAARLQDELSTHLDAVADRYELPGRDRAELFIGIATPLDRRSAADLLSARAIQYLRDPEAFGRLIEGLEARQCWPEVLRLLSACVEANPEPEIKVATLKHLAHVASEILGDPATTIRHLEAALLLAPTDPDLLLPLLDHHFSRTELSRAIELTERVLEHVRMGDAAYAALAHRAADAAIAQDQIERAIALLDRVVERIPDDAKAQGRAAELRSRVNEPRHRVRLLAAVAARQSGRSRIEALEERARLLIDPLERFEEAMEDLASVVHEAPERIASTELLASLYRDHQRFTELVALHEAELPRRHGRARAQILQEIATLYRDELNDPPRAERALRLAIEELGPSAEERVLADALRQELADNLEGQGRYIDLSVYLEQELETELDSELAVEDTPAPPRLTLIQTLARVLRDHLEDESRAAQLYESLERWHALPDEGLATLARWYGRTRRHEDLVRVLQLRSLALEEHSERRAAADLRIAELLDGPLARPHDAAPYYLEAYLANPETHAAEGARARVLLSGVDSVLNVRRRLLRRLEDLDPTRRPALLTLLADVLAPHEDHEEEAEVRYREALAIDGSLAGAWDGLGRLLSRLDRRSEAAQALVEAANSHGLPPARAAEAAALAARNFIEQERFPEAEAALEQALDRSPDSQRALLELARLYEHNGRRDELGRVLDRLAELPLSSTVLAEVAYRRALQLQPIYERVPTGPQGEKARSHLLEALGANPRHHAARQALLGLATARREWSIVAHMHYLAIRELPLGVQRALVHLDLAATYLDHLGDPGSAMRNIESALQQAATDVVVGNRTGDLARRMPDRSAAAERFENIASGDNELDDPARARLWLLAADLRMEDDDHDAAEAASKRVLDLPAVPQATTAAANRTLDRLGPQDPESLVAARAGIVAQLDSTPPPSPRERVQLLGRLHDVGVAMDDEDLVERATREQLELAADLDESDDNAPTTGALLRDLLAARGEYGPVVELYERLAATAGNHDPDRAAQVLVEAAGYAWRGQEDPSQAAQLLGRALQQAPEDEAAARMLTELTLEVTEADVAEDVFRELCRVPAEARPPILNLRLAALATVRNAEAEALAFVRPLTEPGMPDAVRYEALGRLDALLASRGEKEERRQMLAVYFDLARHRRDPRAGDLGLELARLQRAEGDRAAARETGEITRDIAPDHRELLHLMAELAEQDEDWATQADLFEQLAPLAMDDSEQAMWLTRAARIHLEHPDVSGHSDSSLLARRLLLRATEVDPEGHEARVALLPLAFNQARWDEVLQLADGLMRQGADHEVLVLAALAEAYRRGEQKLAREIGYRHPPEVIRQVLLPGIQQVLAEVAMRGPLPRLDPVLGVGSALLGGRKHLGQWLEAWASERPPEPGLTLGLARLLEAQGSGDLARHQFQLTAFLAPRGPVPALVARLPGHRVSGLDLHHLSTAPMESRSMLRQVLTSLRDHLSGLGTRGAPTPAPAHRRPPDWWTNRIEMAETIVEPWRTMLGLDLPLAWSEHEFLGSVAARNDRPPRLVLGRNCAELERPELAFRLAYATATIALGIAILDSGAIPSGVLLDALVQLANPGHQPTGHQARAIADVLAARNAYSIGLTAPQRAGLMDELAHWLTIEGGLARLGIALRRARLLLATRLSGSLHGALQAIARDHGLTQEDRVEAQATMRLDDTTWLLRALSLR